MTASIYLITGVLLFFLGLFGAIATTHLVRKILALNVTGVGVFLVLVSVARGAEANIPDPVPHAMVLTGIVVAMAISAFALGLARQIALRTGAWTLPEDRP